MKPQILNARGYIHTATHQKSHPNSLNMHKAHEFTPILELFIVPNEKNIYK